MSFNEIESKWVKFHAPNKEEEYDVGGVAVSDGDRGDDISRRRMAAQRKQDEPDARNVVVSSTSSGGG